MGLECVKKAHALLIESGEWKVEKVTSKGDTITSTCKDRVGKIYKLTVSPIMRFLIRLNSFIEVYL